jgi:hypothetical protein
VIRAACGSVTETAGVRRVSDEHTVEELDGLHVFGCHGRRVDCELGVVLCGVEDVAPCAGGGQYGHREGARRVKGRFERA